ncbi:MAG: RNA polymerase sigma factor [Ktedonobacteraceae bacterium]
MYRTSHIQQDAGKSAAPEQGPPYGDNSETAQLYQLHAGRLLDYFYQHVSNQPDAEDLLLEVFLIARKCEGMLGNMLEQEQRAWLWTVARNKLIDHYRRNGRRRIIPLEHIAELLDKEEHMPEELILQREEHALLLSHLKRLSMLQQEVLELRFTAGLRCAEIATVLHKREGAIRTMLSRALNILRSYYE